MKKSLALLCMMAFYQYVFCETSPETTPVKRPKIMLAANYGYSSPYSSYAKSVDLSTDGFAKSGTFVSFEMTKTKSCWHGYSAWISIGNHISNTDKVMSSINGSTINGQPITQQTLLTKEKDESIKPTKKWMYSTVFFGPMFYYNKGKFTQEIRFMGGLVFGKTPNYAFSNENKLPENATKFNNNGGVCGGGVGGAVSTTSQYNITKNTVLRLTVQLSGGRIGYELPYEYALQEGQPLKSDYKFEQKVRTAEVMLGVGFQIFN
jgi:hypothetical protein